MNILIDQGKYYFYNDIRIEKQLPVANYELQHDVKGNCWLQTLEPFKVPQKIYETGTMDRVIMKKCFFSENKNMGVLLTGNKGQGKSLDAKLLSKETELPVICVNRSIPIGTDFISFLNDIKQDYVLFIDEFEKLFKSGGYSDDVDGDGGSKMHTQQSFLTFMDGVLTNSNKILFLLTTNSDVNEYFINRTSRIKFLKRYDELPEELFLSICNDRLKNHPKKDELIKDLELNISLVNLNIDVLISIIDDVILLDRPYSEFANIYNYSIEKYKYELYASTDGEKEKLVDFISVGYKLRPDSNYVSGYNITNMLKLTKDEIDFESISSGKKDKMTKTTYRMVPFKSMSQSANKEAFTV